MQPRIYVYLITFVDQPYWYWGVHKEKKFDEYYMGSPVTNKKYWELYEPIKEIVQVFEYSEEGETLARSFESQLIKPDLNNPFCLNEHCGGMVSSKVLSEALRKKWEDPEYWVKMCKISKARWQNPEYKEKMSRSVSRAMKDPEYKEKISKVRKERWKDGEYRSKVVNSQKEAFARKEHQKGERNSQHGTMWITDGEENRKVNKAEDIPVGFRKGRTMPSAKQGLDPKELEAMRERIKPLNSNKWMCLETGYISTAAGLHSYQRARGIDPSKRVAVS